MENKNNQQTPVQPAPASTPAPMQPWPEQTPTPAKIQYVVMQRSLNGIGGWLIFWMVIFSLNGLGFIARFFTQLTTGATTASEIVTTIFAPFIAISCIASVIVIALRKMYGKLASIASIGVMALYSVINSVITASEGASSAGVGAAVSGIIATIVFSGLMILYFVSSKRIKQTLVE